MTQGTSSYRLDSGRIERAEALVDPALAFLKERGYPLGRTLIAYHWRDGAAPDVLDALAAYQNDDGGFGKGLEVDIASPVSNPFAARLAMQVLLSPRDRPSGALVDRLGTWLRETQAEDGDWHFAPEVYDAALPPWFAGWTFPSLNPACCVTGLAIRLGLDTPAMRERVARLFAERASFDDARTGEFYALLPYVEYVGFGDVDTRDSWLDAIAGNITDTASRGGYADASHFFEHALGGGPELTARIPADMLDAQVDALLAEGEADGGWPSPYDPGWRPWITAEALTVLARLRDGV